MLSESATGRTHRTRLKKSRLDTSRLDSIDRAAFTAERE